jgi:hypothetical protein
MEWSQDEMIADALKVHETDHCGTTPCADAVKLALLLGRGGTIEHGHELTKPSYGRGCGNRRGTQVSTSASDKQLGLIRKLATERDYLSLGDTQRKLVQDVCTGTTISKSSASALIDALLHTVYADAKSLRPEFLPAEPKASDKQIALIVRLGAERGRTYRDELLAEMTRSEASELIDGLVALPRVAQTTGPAAELEAGIYRVDDVIYKVQKAVHGSGRMYAKQLVIDGPGSAHFEIAPGAIHEITSEHRMSLEEAVSYGQLYGVCVRCGATLTDETSIEAGIGPICAGKL